MVWVKALLILLYGRWHEYGSLYVCVKYHKCSHHFPLLGTFHPSIASRKRSKTKGDKHCDAPPPPPRARPPRGACRRSVEAAVCVQDGPIWLRGILHVPNTGARRAHSPLESSAKLIRLHSCQLALVWKIAHCNRFGRIIVSHYGLTASGKAQPL